ncbi:O-methyltransferase involved in polyketide biosynthesis [Streptosporangium album]|uniref:O-methyltransferase involved in polyketide biosynthesis n=1 Tax=Streptosporangium album TaxID=47479 RepID=A0A7W7RR72_9ACTN|nr:SAM-dependent methyltransferase [Streptosporangium album]MBB4936158.1 O-methyltransferase involved in polyketide biosynthesis [Streptosporangium album]
MVEEEWARRGIDVNTPSVARLYDYYLGGKDHFAADRAAAEEILSIAPELRMAARENRAFLGRAVRFAAEAGIRQFLDIGTGLPTRGNVHEVAHQVAPDARIAYVDNDPIVLVHARALLRDAREQVTVAPGDLRQPEEILKSPEVQHHFDFSAPMAVLLVAVMHFITESDDPRRIVATLRDAMPSGSYLILSHGTGEHRAEAADRGTKVYERANSPLVLRPRQEILDLFDGFELVDPGLVWLPEWRPDGPPPHGDPSQELIMCGVGKKV